MKHWLAKVAEILEANTSDVRLLAAIAGANPRNFYLGSGLRIEDLPGQDLTGILLDESAPGLNSADHVSKKYEFRSEGTTSLASALAEKAMVINAISSVSHQLRDIFTPLVVNADKILAVPQLEANDRRSINKVMQSALSSIKLLEEHFNNFESYRQRVNSTELIERLCHELSYDLTPLVGYVDVIRTSKSVSDPMFHEYMELFGGAGRATSVIDQLAALTGKRYALEDQDVGDEIVSKELLIVLKNLVGDKFSLELENDGIDGSTNAHTRDIGQVLVNLVVNAKDSMPHGGAISIKVNTYSQLDQNEVGGVQLPKGKYICIAVTDSGVGIKADVGKKMWEPFVSTKGSRSGLDLPICAGLVKRNSGYFFCESTVGVGSKFSVYLPLVQGAKSKFETVINTSGSVGADLTSKVAILIHDDQESDLIKTMLHVSFVSAQRFLDIDELMRTSAQNNNHPMILIVSTGRDVLDCDGDFIQNLSKIKNLRVLVLSTSFEATDTMPLNYKGLHFLPKPFKIKELMRALVRCSECTRTVIT